MPQSPAVLPFFLSSSLVLPQTKTDLIARLDAYAATEFNNVQRLDEILFENLFALEKHPEGARKTQPTICSTVKDFQKVLSLQNVDIEDLDI